MHQHTGAFRLSATVLLIWAQILFASSTTGQANVSLIPSAPRLNVCIITADFWGIDMIENSRGATLSGGGGTATAFHLLANLLREDPGLKVSFPWCHARGGHLPQGTKGRLLLHTHSMPQMRNADSVHLCLLNTDIMLLLLSSALHLAWSLSHRLSQVHKASGLSFYCLEKQHFAPRIVESFPYEALSVRPPSAT